MRGDAAKGVFDNLPPDWMVIHQRMESALNHLERVFDLSAEEKTRVLTERARELARVEERHERTERGLRVVEFLLSRESYAVELEWIREVLPVKEVTPVPCSPGFVVGLVNIRGQILSVIDLKEIFALPAEDGSGPGRLMILHTDEMEVGVLVDRVVGERSLAADEIKAPPPRLKEGRPDYLKGVTAGRLILLDVAKFLSDKNIIVEEEVLK